MTKAEVLKPYPDTPPPGPSSSPETNKEHHILLVDFVVVSQEFKEVERKSISPQILLIFSSDFGCTENGKRTTIQRTSKRGERTTTYCGCCSRTFRKSE
jgi:hypothetical protein